MNRVKKCLLLVVTCFLVTTITCTRSTDTFVTEAGEGGFTEMILFNGDTIFVPEHLKNRENAPRRKGMFIHYHLTEDSIKDFFAVEGAGIILPHIQDIVKNDDYMLIDQKPLDSILGPYTRKYYNENDYYYIREYDTINNLEGTISMVEKSNIHCFWIIAIKTADIYGPFSFEAYLDKKKELKVPDSLVLEYERQHCFTR